MCDGWCGGGDECEETVWSLSMSSSVRKAEEGDGLKI